MRLPWLKYAESDQNAGWYKAGYRVHLPSNYVQQLGGSKATQATGTTVRFLTKEIRCGK
jgi:hypothetical protein